MKKTILILCSILISSCGDFKQEKFTEGPSASREVTGSDTLLDNLESINTGDFSIDKVLLNFGINVMTPTVNKFAQNIENLDSSLNLYCDAIESFPEDMYKENVFQTLKNKLQSEWRAAMGTYHFLEAFKFGIIAQNADELALSIYAWPLQNSCRINLEIAKNTRKNDYEVTSYNLKGLGAFETVLFTPEGEHNCSSTPVFLSKWMSESPKVRHIDQCNYLKKISTDLKKQSRLLLEKWDIKKENASIDLVKGKSQAQKIASLNEFSNSLFYIEKIVKDAKLGPISGILNCKKVSCPENVEHLISKFSTESVIANLKGFYSAFNGLDPDTGLNGMGMDDYLRNQNHQSVAQAINTATLDAIAQFEKHVGGKTLFELSKEVNKALCEESTSKNRAVEICSLYQDLRGITTLLKNDYILALRDIEAPAQSQGDMD